MNDFKLLEDLLANHGQILTHQSLVNKFSYLKNPNNKIHSLVKKGWLVNLRRGLYYLAELGSLSYASISSYLVANAVGPESFVSFEAALQFHNFFDQGLNKYRSISKKQYLNKELEGIRYEYIKTKEKNFFGFRQERVNGGIARIASTERALLDLVEYKKTSFSVSLVLETLKLHASNLDLQIIYQSLKNYSKVTTKTFGLFLDLTQQNSQPILQLLKEDSSRSKLLPSSDKFSSKWNLYYDYALEKQLK